MNLNDILKPKSEEDIMSLLENSNIEIKQDLLDVTSRESRCEQHIMIKRYYINDIEYDYNIIKKYLKNAKI